VEEMGGIFFLPGPLVIEIDGGIFSSYFLIAS
jgi:hypothetical protein